jgi:hypothetical protein
LRRQPERTGDIHLPDAADDDLEAVGKGQEVSAPEGPRALVGALLPPEGPMIDDGAGPALAAGSKRQNSPYRPHGAISPQRTQETVSPPDGYWPAQGGLVLSPNRSAPKMAGIGSGTRYAPIAADGFTKPTETGLGGDDCMTLNRAEHGGRRVG